MRKARFTEGQVNGQHDGPVCRRGLTLRFAGAATNLPWRP